MVHLAAEHFVRAPNWALWILLYFFFAGIAGGSYVLGALFRLWVRPRDPGAARTAFVTSLVAVAICPVFLTIDLGRPERFWHMLLDTGAGTLAFKYWSPMSVGAYGLSIFGVFAFVSAVESVFPKWMAWWPSALNAVWLAVGAVFGTFIAGYTGVLLAVSNQPVWSDAGWALGGLFLASGLSGAAALLVLLVRRGRSAGAVEEADRWFVAVEAVLVVVFLVSLALAGTLARLFSPLMILLWVLVLAGLAAPFYLRRRAGIAAFSPVLVLLGVLALRAVVIFGPQT